MTPLLETPRLHLRGLRHGDARRLAEYLSNFAVVGNLAHAPHPHTIEDTHRWLSRWCVDAAPKETNFVIELKGEGAVGAVGFHDHDGDAVLGYWLGEPFWGRGLMTETLHAALDWYFEVTDADIVVSGLFYFNMASAALQMKLGFVETGRSTCHCLARGEELEHIDTELTREAYQLSRQKSKKAAAQ